MEAHLHRQRSSHQNSKSRRALKETTAAPSDFGVGASCSSTITTTTPVTSGTTGVLSSSNSNPIEYHNLAEGKQIDLYRNLDSFPFTDLSQSKSTLHNSNNVSTTASPPSSSNVQIQSGLVVGLAQTGAQHQEQPSSVGNHSTKDYQDDEEKVDEEQEQGQRGTTSSCTRSSTTGSVSTSHSILLGTFCNNLSSPDTGYSSTDGYSPKSVYPALSFESSGKSTPKSSYTISSLVSSELHLSSKGHTASLSSASCSVNNGLESDHEFTSPIPSAPLKTSASLPPHSETDRSISNLGLGDRDGHIINEKRASQDSSRLEERSSVSINQNQAGFKQQPPSRSTWDDYRANDSHVSDTQCNSTKPSVASPPPGEFSPHQPSSSIHTGESGASDSMVAANQPLSNFTGQSIRQEHNNNGSFGPKFESQSHNFSKSTNPFCSNQIQSSPAATDNNHHRRIEILDDERKSNVLPTPDISEGSNSSSALTAAASSTNRNIRTSFVLVTPATSQIQECNGYGLKNSFSISSPSKRTRIKTNGSLMILHGNSNANKVEPTTSPAAVIRVNYKEKGASHKFSSVSESAVMEKASCIMHCENQNLRSGEINSRGEIENGMDQQSADSMSLVYRISTSASASDSGKGSLDLEPGTNRNSTESSCLLSDFASTRNSVISHETGCSRSSSTSSASLFLPNNHSNTEGSQGVERKGSGDTKVGNSAKSSAKSTPSSVKKVTPKLHHNNNKLINGNDPSNQLEEDQDATSTSITLPREFRHSASVSAQTNVIMVDKETDILSDWANTDDDGEDEIETDRNDDDDYDDEEDRVTPTPSSPDIDTGGRVMFNQSRSTSSVTDIDFGDSSAATAASSNGIAPSSSIFRSHYNQNLGKNYSTNKDKSVPLDPYQYHQNNIIMRAQTTCYTVPQSFNPQQDEESALQWHVESGMFGNSYTNEEKSGVMCPTGHPLGIPNAHISLSSSVYADASTEFQDENDYNANKPPTSSSNAIARGALGFLRKIFKKGSCSSSHRTSPGSDKVKIPRSAKSKDSHLDNIASITGLRSNSLLTTSITTADALVSPHPLAGRKSSINGYFLTPTPNAFRRRSCAASGGTDSSDSTKGGSGSKHAKSVKTDIIRLPSGPLSPTTTQHGNSSLSTASSKNTSIGAFCISSSQNATYRTGNGNNNTPGYSNTNTNSTASSIHSMSTSTSASTNGGGLLLGNGGEILASGHTPTSRRQQNQSRLNDNFYLNSSSNRQSPYMSNEARVREVEGPYNPILVGTHSNNPPPPQPPTLPQSPYTQHVHHPSYNHRLSPTPFHNESSTSHQIHHQQEKDNLRPKARAGPCPNESPRVANLHQIENPHHRINSPSFNNYSPIHRLVVTNGAQQLLGRGPSNNNPSNCASPFPHHQSSPTLPLRNNGNVGDEGVGSSNHHNNNTPSNGALIPNINRTSSFHPNTSMAYAPSPLINHQPHQQHQHPEFSVSSPHHQHHLQSSNTFTSPSPVLRNPRYQYITSSNQNSPVLNIPKRMNGSAPNHPPPNNQQIYYHNQKQGHGGEPFPKGPYQPTFSTFSPTPPPRQIPPPNNSKNPFSTASPNLNHNQLRSQEQGNNCMTNPAQYRREVGFESVNSPNPNPRRGENNPIPPGSSSNNRNKLLRSQSYQTQDQSHSQSHPVHYYASPVAVIPQPETQTRMLIPHPHQYSNHGPMHPTSLSFNEPPLLMRAHLHNQNIRFNNFLRNKQQSQQIPIAPVEQFPHSESFQERIYESVDSVDEEDDDEDENRNLDEQEITRHHHHQQQQPFYFHPNFHPNTNGVLEQLRKKNRLPTAISNLESGFPSSNKMNTAITTVPSESKSQQSSKSKRSKTKPPMYDRSQLHGESGGSVSCQQPRPPVPMSFFGPNTFLSETETRLLETDEREADRKYKRLINEAESLLMEISNLKKEPWAQAQQQPSRMQDRLRIEDCPQSDPLRRKVCTYISHILLFT